MLVSEIPLPSSWPYGGATLSLRLFYNRTWTDEDGQVRLAGRPGPGSPCLICPGTVAGTAGTVQAFAHPPTVNSPDRPRVRVTGVLFDANGRQRDVLFRNWRFPSGLDQLSWTDFTIFNNTKLKRLADKYPTIEQVIEMIAGNIGGQTITAHGLAQLAAGAVTVPLASVTANSRAIAIGQDDDVTGALRATNYVVGVGFDIVSANGADSGSVLWILLEN